MHLGELLFAVLALCHVQWVHSACCRPGTFVHGSNKCGDGTPLNGYCCGYGSCNLFCCECKGGCRDAKSLVSFKAGDILVCHIRLGVYHVMLAINNEEVIHADGGSLTQSTAKIRRQSFRSARGGMNFCHVETEYYDSYAKNNFNVDKYSDDIAVQKAKQSVERNKGKTVDYDLFENNCEHWVTEWKYGVRFSIQNKERKIDVLRP